MKKVFTTAFIAMLSLSAFAQTKADTLVVTTTPEMHCEGCENKIKKNIRFVKGTKKIETSVPNQTVISRLPHRIPGARPYYQGADCHR